MKVIYENKALPIDYEIQKNLSPLPHIHKEIEIIYVTEGTSLAFADRQQYKLGKGDVFIAFPNQVHFFEKSTFGVYNVMVMQPELIFGLFERISEHCPENNVIHAGEGSFVEKIFSLCEKAGGDLKYTALNGYMNLLFAEVFPQLKLKPLLKSDNSALHGILEFCSHNYTDKLTLDTVAREVHLNKYYVSHLLSAKINLTFTDYINNLRVSAACELLRETDKKISDISEDVGFGTIRSFNRAFRQLMNTTPERYREFMKD